MDEELRKSDGPPEVSRESERESSEVARRRQIVQVLERAMLAASGDQATVARTVPAELVAIRRVRRRYGADQTLDEPIAAEVIEAVLEETALPRLRQSPACREMARHVVRTVIDDAPSRSRLEHLWTRLTEGGDEQSRVHRRT